MDKEIIVLIISLSFSLVMSIGAAVSNIIIALISNSDKVKKDVSDFELDEFWDKEKIIKIYEAGELNNYNKASKSRIEKKYKEYRKVEKELEEAVRKAAEEEESVFALASDGPKCNIKNFPENKPIEVEDDKK